MKWLAPWLLWVCAASAWAQTPAMTCAVKILDVRAAQAHADGGQPDASNWRRVTLPDLWNRDHPDFDGGSVWYRIDWRRDCADEPETRPVALLLQSIYLAGEVFVNGHLLWRDAHLTEPLSRSWNMPRLWTLREDWLHDGVNTLTVRVTGAGGGQSVGLGPVLLGEPEKLARLHDDLLWRGRTLFEINLIVSVVIGVLFFCVWLMRRDQSFYGWYAVSSLFWVAFVAHILAASPWPFASSLALARADVIMLLLCVACLCMFIWRFGEQTLPRAERALWSVTAILAVMLAVMPDALVGMGQMAGFLAASAIFQINCLQFIVYAWRTRQSERRVLAVCFIVLMAAGFHDFLILMHLIQAEPIFPYASVVNTLALSIIMGLRHARNLKRIEHFNQELTRSVTQARDEVAQTLERAHALTLTNTRLQERLRIAHDLHDGLGGSLVHMMASIEQNAGPLQKPQVLAMLKFIRDDLRQTIDSDSSMGITVPATPREWIAPLRHRFTVLLDELGIASDWHTPLAWRTAPTAQQCLALTRLIEEALTNVIKHSRARRMRLRLDQPESDRLTLEIEDNGVGFDVTAVRQAGISIGMRSMSVRIARVDGSLDVRSEPGRTVLTAILKMNPNTNKARELK